jgi:hypothetical protein
MAQPMPDEAAYTYYYDRHPTEEDLMSESPPHAWLIHYLMEVLYCLFHGRVSAIHENYAMYYSDEEHEQPIVPDIAIMKGIKRRTKRSYRINIDGPIPQVVFEIASEETWRRDLMEKPHIYGDIGIKEYYAFDPYEPLLPLSSKQGGPLFGWHRDARTGLMREVALKPSGIWSPGLDSYLVPDGEYLRLYDRSGNRRLTEAEQETKRADEEARRADEEAWHAKQEARRAKLADQRAKLADQRADEEARQKQIFAEKLRSMGIDPDQLL